MSEETAHPSDINVVDASTRQAWLSKLEINGKVKDGILSSLAQGDISTALQLLESGQAAKRDIRTKDNKSPTGLTALHLASLFGDDVVFQKLLELNVDTNVTCYCQITSYSVATKFWMDARPLLFAIGSKNQHIVNKLLAQSSSVTMNDAWPLFSTEWWRLTGRFEWDASRAILRNLVQHNLDLNQRVAILRWSMLHYCVNMEPRTWDGIEEFLQGRYETIEYLIENGSEPLLKDTFGRTALALLQERTNSLPSTGIADADLAILERVRDAADERLKELLQKAMVAQVDKIQAKTGFRGSLHKLAIRGQALDRIPLLLRSGASSFRRSSVSSAGMRSQLSN
ncbi:hypothetical protein AMS68_005489 [Peltaster fructicola]|uniref:Uncharacterized protein n=1 Tax=Peltaster fructicola TaxID=286661 RepID=A0A6H0XYX3_9PEZI|nr:hypothetical protein AMS68_005489 [Peltaster fructicola]